MSTRQLSQFELVVRIGASPRFLVRASEQGEAAEFTVGGIGSERADLLQTLLRELADRYPVGAPVAVEVNDTDEITGLA